jgi:hypothetical protein
VTEPEVTVSVIEPTSPMQVRWARWERIVEAAGGRHTLAVAVFPDRGVIVSSQSHWHDSADASPPVPPTRAEVAAAVKACREALGAAESEAAQ